MMDSTERTTALAEMQLVSNDFYARAAKIGVHPFIEFCGLMNEYIKCCEYAHKQGIDFSECNKHTGEHLPMQPFAVGYINEKLECIFTGRSIVQEQDLVKKYELRLEENHGFVDTASLSMETYDGLFMTLEAVVNTLPWAVVVTRIENGVVYVQSPASYTPASEINCSTGE